MYLNVLCRNGILDSLPFSGMEQSKGKGGGGTDRSLVLSFVSSNHEVYSPKSPGWIRTQRKNSIAICKELLKNTSLYRL